KDVNDRFGHPIGDQVLVRLAAMLSDGVRGGGDLVARIGGEEFLLIIHNVGASAQEVLQRIAHDWQEQSGGSTFSAGIAVNLAGATPVRGGLGAAAAIGFATIVFAGASQLAAINVLIAGGSALVAALAAWMINLRLLLYSASLAPHLAREPLWKRLLIAYTLT